MRGGREFSRGCRRWGRRSRPRNPDRGNERRCLTWRAPIPHYKLLHHSVLKGRGFSRAVTPRDRRWLQPEMSYETACNLFEAKFETAPTDSLAYLRPLRSNAKGRITDEVGKMPRQVWPVVAAHWSRPGYYTGMCSHVEAVPNKRDYAKHAGVHGVGYV
jgi:hypothetical protein